MLARVGESRRLMRRVLDLHPDQKLTEEANSFLEMTELEQKSESLAPFERQIQRVLATDPTYVPALLAKAKLQVQRGDSKSAIDIYTEILQRYPDFPLAQKYLAGLYVEDPVHSDEAYSLALRARNALPADRELANTLGEISYKKQNYAYAVECFYESARHSPLRGKELYYLGMAQIQTGEITSGQQALTRALDMGLQEPLATLARERLAAQLTK
jgi:tetratricopeptide (TPR) repeat protein